MTEMEMTQADKATVEGLMALVDTYRHRLVSSRNGDAMCEIGATYNAIRAYAAQLAQPSAPATEYAECYVCARPMDGLSEDDCHCFHRKEFAAAPPSAPTDAQPAAQPLVAKVTAAQFDAAWSAFGATQFEDLHSVLSIDHIRRLFKMFSACVERPAAQPSAPASTDALHQQIMNLPCKLSTITHPSNLSWYKHGHRAARHAAAELVLAQPAAQEGQQPATYVGWYCANCKRGVDSSEVTFGEQHTTCGRVITNDVPPAVAQEGLALTLNAEELFAVLEEMGDHSSDDFEAECPGCTACRKLTAAASLTSKKD